MWLQAQAVTECQYNQMRVVTLGPLACLVLRLKLWFSIVGHFLQSPEGPRVPEQILDPMVGHDCAEAPTACTYFHGIHTKFLLARSGLRQPLGSCCCGDVMKRVCLGAVELQLHLLTQTIMCRHCCT